MREEETDIRYFVALGAMIVMPGYYCQRANAPRWFSGRAGREASAADTRLEQERRRRRVVVDCVQVNHELEMLQLRLYELADVVDFHVVVEDNITHTGQPKRQYVREHLALFPPELRRKVIIVGPDDAWQASLSKGRHMKKTRNAKGARANEHTMRNAIAVSLLCVRACSFGVSTNQAVSLYFV